MGKPSEISPVLVAIAEDFVKRLKDSRYTPQRPAGAKAIIKGYKERGIRITDGDLRDLVNYLRRTGSPIGSRSSKPSGYWWAYTEGDLLETEKGLLHREVSMRAARIGMMSSFRPKQEAMDFPESA